MKWIISLCITIRKNQFLNSCLIEELNRKMDNRQGIRVKDRRESFERWKTEK